MWLIVGGVQNEDAEEDSHLDLNPGWAAVPHRTYGLGAQPCIVLLAVWENAGDVVGRERGKELSLVGQEKVPCGCGLRTGDCSNTADSSGDCGRPSSGAMDFYFS